MADIKNSRYLDYLIEDMRKYDTEGSKGNTAEKFLLAVIDSLRSSEESNDDIKTERFILAKSIKDAGLDLNYFEKRVKQQISSEAYSAGMSAMYFQITLANAAKRAKESNCEEIGAHLLFQVMLTAPSEFMKSVLNDSSKGSAGEEKKFDFLFSSEDRGESRDKDKSTDDEPGCAKGSLLDITLKTSEIQKFLSSNVLGQSKAINVFSAGYFRAELLSMIDKSRKRPKATFLFAGPPGVGKTFMAEKAAEALKLPFKRFDMSEYCDKEASIEFIGSDNVYKNAKSGNFTSFVAENPKSLILFDEIEKAHTSIIHLFLQILDAGRIRDSKTDEEISLANTIMIFTTNAGKQLYEGSDADDFSSISRKVILKSLETDINPATGAPYFPAAICSRFASGNVVMFNHIKAHGLREIAKKEIIHQAQCFKKETGVSVEISDDVYTSLLFAEGGSADARTIRSRAEAFLNDELYELFRLINSPENSSIIDNLEKITFRVAIPQNTEAIASLYNSRDSAQALIFSDSDTAEYCKAGCGDITFYTADNIDAASIIIAENDVKFALVDITLGVTEGERHLNLEDSDSAARDFLKEMLEKHGSIPIYIIERGERRLSDEEKLSFTSKGVRGFISLSSEGWAEELKDISETIHQQNSINELARANKIISFETAQDLTSDGKCAEITLFDLKTATAIDSQDSGSILNNVSKPNVRFSDVIGAEDAKDELKYFVNYLKHPKTFLSKGVKPPKGVILHGPPGTGKTMLAKAMACESDVTFIVAEGNQFLKKYVGEGSEKVHELFKTARKYAPSILFIDEIDAIAKERKGGEFSAGVEETLTAFLAEMDGFKNDASKPVFVLAATNFEVEPGSAKSLDPALMRRFDRRIFVDLPNKDERLKYINQKLAGSALYKLSEEKIDNIITRSTGMSIAQLESVFELALRTVIRSEGNCVTDEIFDEAFEIFNGGEQKTWDNNLLERVARHECGHALLCWLSGETPSYLTIVARGNHGGYMQHADNENKALYTKNELLSRIRTSLGGRAAELVCYGEEDGLSTGASEDIRSATSLARNMICSYGMVSKFGLATISADELNSDVLSKEVCDGVNEILAEQMQSAVDAINSHRPLFDALVSVLLEKNHISGKEIDALLNSIN